MKSVYEAPTGKGNIYAHSFPFVQEVVAMQKEPNQEVKSGSMILLSTGECSPASPTPCPLGDLGRLRAVSGDQSMKTSPKGSIWAQKLRFCEELRNAQARLSQANRKTFHEALRRCFKKRKVEPFKEESSALSKNWAF